MNIDELKNNPTQKHINDIYENIYSLEDAIDACNIISDSYNLGYICKEDEKFFGLLRRQQLDRVLIDIHKIFDINDSRTSSLCDLLRITTKNFLEYFSEKEAEEIKRLQEIRGQHVAHTDKDRKDGIVYLPWGKHLSEKAKKLLDDYIKEKPYLKTDNNFSILYQGFIKIIAGLSPALLELNDGDKSKAVTKNIYVRNNLLARIEENYLCSGILSEQEFIYAVFETANRMSNIKMIPIDFDNWVISRNLSNYFSLLYQIDFGDAKLNYEHIKQLYPKVWHDDADISKLIEEVAPDSGCAHDPMKEIIAKIKQIYKDYKLPA